jgi:NhaP-type Na+/H+ or K+/H+ antiporter
VTLCQDVIGVAGGLLIGWLLGKLFFRAPSELRLARHAEGFLALAATFLAYGLVEVVGGYGFLAVFVAARAIRAAERTHEFHSVLHDFAGVTAADSVAAALRRQVLDWLAPDWQAASGSLIFLVRPLFIGHAAARPTAANTVSRSASGASARSITRVRYHEDRFRWRSIWATVIWW